MAANVKFSAGLLLAGLLANGSAVAQKSDAPAPEAPGLRLNEAIVLLDYQVIRVAGDVPIDLMGFHVLNKVGDGLYVGAGLFAPLVKGVYGVDSRKTLTVTEEVEEGGVTQVSFGQVEVTIRRP